MTTGVSPSRIETQELVVPRSMPMTRSISPFRSSVSWGLWEDRGLEYGSAELALQPPDPIAYLIIARRKRLCSGKLALSALFHAGFDVETGQSHPEPSVIGLQQDGLFGHFPG